MIIYYIRKPSRNKNGWLIQSRVSEYNNVVITTVGSLINMAASSTGASWVSWSTVTWLEGVEHHQLPPATNTEVISSACAKWTLALALFQEISEAACLPMNFRRWLKKTTREWDGNMFFFFTRTTTYQTSGYHSVLIFRDGTEMMKGVLVIQSTLLQWTSVCEMNNWFRQLSGKNINWTVEWSVSIWQILVGFSTFFHFKELEMLPFTLPLGRNVHAWYCCRCCWCLTWFPSLHWRVLFPREGWRWSEADQNV